MTSILVNSAQNHNPFTVMLLPHQPDAVDSNFDSRENPGNIQSPLLSQSPHLIMHHHPSWPLTVSSANAAGTDGSNGSFPFHNFMLNTDVTAMSQPQPLPGIHESFTNTRSSTDSFSMGFNTINTNMAHLQTASFIPSQSNSSSSSAETSTNKVNNEYNWLSNQHVREQSDVSLSEKQLKLENSNNMSPWCELSFVHNSNTFHNSATSSAQSLQHPMVQLPSANVLLQPALPQTSNPNLYAQTTNVLYTASNNDNDDFSDIASVLDNNSQEVATSTGVPLTNSASTCLASLLSQPVSGTTQQQQQQVLSNHGGYSSTPFCNKFSSSPGSVCTSECTECSVSTPPTVAAVSSNGTPIKLNKNNCTPGPGGSLLNTIRLETLMSREYETDDTPVITLQPGVYGFQAAFEEMRHQMVVIQKSQREENVHHIFARPDYNWILAFKVSHPVPPNCFVRLTAVPADSSCFRTVVRKCNGHVKSDRTSSTVEEILSVLKVAHEHCVYQCSEESRRYSVVFPYTPPAEGSDVSKVSCYFTCYSRDWGAKKNSYALLATLEQPASQQTGRIGRNQVLGRFYTHIRCCACPVRDVEGRKREIRNVPDSGTHPHLLRKASMEESSAMRQLASSSIDDLESLFESPRKVPNQQPNVPNSGNFVPVDLQGQSTTNKDLEFGRGRVIQHLDEMSLKEENWMEHGGEWYALYPVPVRCHLVRQVMRSLHALCQTHCCQPPVRTEAGTMSTGHGISQLQGEPPSSASSSSSSAGTSVSAALHQHQQQQQVAQQNMMLMMLTPDASANTPNLLSSSHFLYKQEKCEMPPIMTLGPYPSVQSVVPSTKQPMFPHDPKQQQDALMMASFMSHHHQSHTSDNNFMFLPPGGAVVNFSNRCQSSSVFDEIDGPTILRKGVDLTRLRESPVTQPESGNSSLYQN